MGSLLCAVVQCCQWLLTLPGQPNTVTEMMRQCLILSLALGLALAMDLGRSGVYDSPMAQDYYVRRFGFMFGGGQSGMYGIEALQQVEDPMHLHTRHSSPSPSHHHQHH